MLLRDTMFWYVGLRGSVADERLWASQLKKGVTELAVLAALRTSEAYGYELLQRLATWPLLASTESTVYPLLARLADEKLIAVRQAPSPSGPPRRYYRLTPRGLTHLEELSAHWRQFSEQLDALLSGRFTGDAT